jgi:hypothetical protein
MKHILALVTFVIGALCFAMFLIMVKPDPLSAVTPAGKPEYCEIAVSREPACRSEPEWREH